MYKKIKNYSLPEKSFKKTKNINKNRYSFSPLKPKKRNKRYNKLKPLIYLFFVILGVIIFIIINSILKRKLNPPNIFTECMKNQTYFCDNQNKFFNENFERNIKIAEVKFQNLTFHMHVYTKYDTISSVLVKKKTWESKETENVLKALNYYSNKKNIKNKDIYTIDIGANIGWYSILLGKYGYKVISFEPNENNLYILNKNVCLNKEINIAIINKGLSTEEKKCYLYKQNGNIGNSMVIWDSKDMFPNYSPTTAKEITLTRLSNYIPFLSNKNLAFIKIDVEGLEEKVFKGGIELITKYHVPFILIEFTKDALKFHGTDPEQFLQLFADNGYRFRVSNFLEEKYYSVQKILKICKNQINLYIVHSNILE